jgi:hypothetical protein
VKPTANLSRQVSPDFGAAITNTSPKSDGTSYTKEQLDVGAPQMVGPTCKHREINLRESVPTSSHGSLPSLDWYRFAFDGETAINCEFILCRVRKLELFKVNLGVRDIPFSMFHVDGHTILSNSSTAAYRTNTVTECCHSLVRIGKLVHG